MTNLEFEILQYINSKHKSVSWLEIMNHFHTFGQSLEADGVLHAMLNSRLLQNTDPVHTPPLCKVKLSDSGLLQFIEEKERRQKLVCEEKQAQDQMADARLREETRRKAEAKNEHQFQIKLALTSALVGGAVTYIVTNLDRLIPLLISFFH